MLKRLKALLLERGARQSSEKMAESDLPSTEKKSVAPCGFGRFSHIPCPKASREFLAAVPQPSTKEELINIEQYVSRYVRTSSTEISQLKAEVAQLEAESAEARSALGEFSPRLPAARTE